MTFWEALTTPNGSIVAIIACIAASVAISNLARAIGNRRK